jgi:hypothetical protein
MQEPENVTPPEDQPVREHPPGAPGRPRGADRRRAPTPMLSRYWLGGRRLGGRRGEEKGSIYVDRYTREEVALVAWIGVTAVLDLLLTLRHLAVGGEEANPVMRLALEGGGPGLFAAIKLLMTFSAALFLLLHVRFRGTRAALWGLALLYGAVMLYHAVAFLDRH